MRRLLPAVTLAAVTSAAVTLAAVTLAAVTLAAVIGLGCLLGASRLVAEQPVKKPAQPSPEKAAAKGADQKPAEVSLPGVEAQPTPFWMRKKLDYAQQILGGIAEGDYDRIAQNAASMKALSRIEGFVRGRTPGYRTQLQIFQDATEELMRQAEKENVDGAALAFTQLTISCVNCHKQLREAEKK